MPLKFKLRKGRYSDKKYCFNILRDGNADIHNLLKEKISLEDLSELIYLFFEEFSNQVLENKLGIEIPNNIGYIRVLGLKKPAYKLGQSPSKLGKAVINPNYNTEGYVFRTYYIYTNTDNIVKSRVGLFENAYLYSFKTSKPFREKLTKHIRSGKWKNFPLLNNYSDLLPKSPKKWK